MFMRVHKILWALSTSENVTILAEVDCYKHKLLEIVKFWFDMSIDLFQCSSRCWRIGLS